MWNIGRKSWADGSRKQAKIGARGSNSKMKIEGGQVGGIHLWSGISPNTNPV
jgi:hypothetical protein